MVRVQAPALSLSASGSRGGAMVFSNWKGRAYVRELVKPSNPKSGGQVGIRQMLKFLSQDWTNIGATPQASWEDRADQAVVSPFNSYIGYNMFRWRDFLAPTDTDPEATADSPATMGTLAAVAGVRSITVTQPITTASDGWGVIFFRDTSSSIAVAFDNARHTGKIAATADVVFVDSPLAAGTYYYRCSHFTKDGRKTDEVTEVNAVVA
ncbi:MAG: hypothetical protein V3V75_06660 [Thermoguttaceae bacterium]